MLFLKSDIAIKGESPVQPILLGNLWFWIKDSLAFKDLLHHIVAWWCPEAATKVLRNYGRSEWSTEAALSCFSPALESAR